MTYAFVQDIASTWEHYERFTAATIDPSRTSLILHVAGPTEEGFRIIEVWETEQAWQRFQVERLKPATAALGGPARPRQTFRDLHAAQPRPRTPSRRRLNDPRDAQTTPARQRTPLEMTIAIRAPSPRAPAYNRGPGHVQGSVQGARALSVDAGAITERSPDDRPPR